MNNKIYPLDEIFHIMKPSKIDNRKPKEVAKLEEIKKGNDYTVEEKIDGIHVVIIGNRFFTIRESKTTGFPLEKTQHVPHIVESGLFKEDLAIYEGELYLPGKKVNEVVSITNRKNPEDAVRQQNRTGLLHLRLFDKVRDSDGTWLTAMNWETRRLKLATTMATDSRLNAYYHKTENPFIEVNNSRVCSLIDVDAFIDTILSKDGEGVVFKKRTERYYPGKRPKYNWVKVKASIDSTDVVIIGYEAASKDFTGTGEPTYFSEGKPVSKFYAKNWIGAIQVGMYNQWGDLVSMGKVSGMTDAQREMISENKLKYMHTVIKIKAMEMTENNIFRHPSFVDFHPDKNAWECVLE